MPIDLLVKEVALSKPILNILLVLLGHCQLRDHFEHQHLRRLRLPPKRFRAQKEYQVLRSSGKWEMGNSFWGVEGGTVAPSFLSLSVYCVLR